MVRGILDSAVVVVFLIAALVVWAWLRFCGWPDQHVFLPGFASNISDLGFIDGNEEARVNTTLTINFLRSIKPRASIMAVVEKLDADGFLAKQEIFLFPAPPSGKCPSSQSRLSLWLQGCKNAPADLAKLRTARSGTMWYYWRGLPCTFTIAATWKADERGNVTGIAMNFDPYRACLND